MGDATLIGIMQERMRALEGLGRFKEAFYELQQYKQMNDSLTQADNREQLNELNKRFEVAELQLQNERSRRNFTIALAFATLLTLAVVFYIFYTRRIRRKNRKLYEMITAPLSSPEGDTIVPANKTNEAPSGAVGGPSPLFTSICRLLSSERLYTNADLNRSDLAQHLGTNDRYIADAITEGTGGQTFLQFVNGYRLRRATQLLTETDNPIEQVAFDSGFNNRRTFNRIFRDEFDMSPSDFRRASHQT